MDDGEQPDASCRHAGVIRVWMELVADDAH